MARSCRTNSSLSFLATFVITPPDVLTLFTLRGNPRIGQPQQEKLDKMRIFAKFDLCGHGSRQPSGTPIFVS